MNRFEAGESIESQDFLDGIAEDELRRHPDIETDGDKISNIWAILGLTNEADLARILGVNQRQISEIFENGTTDQLIKRRLDRAYACVSIFERNIPDLFQRDGELKRPHPFLRHRSPRQSLIEGHVNQVLNFAAQTF